jgi:hypothetical protein
MDVMDKYVAIEDLMKHMFIVQVMYVFQQQEMKPHVDDTCPAQHYINTSINWKHQ